MFASDPRVNGSELLRDHATFRGAALIRPCRGRDFAGPIECVQSKLAGDPEPWRV
jgi:hypothetical protein